MAVQTAETFLQHERERYQKQREDLHAKRAEIDQQIAEVDKELYALEVYVQAKQGKFKLPDAAPKAPRAPSTRAPRGKRAENRETILGLLGQGELAAESIYTELQADTPKAKQAIANLLVTMKKDGLIAQAQKRGPYTLGVPSQPEAPGEAA